MAIVRLTSHRIRLPWLDPEWRFVSGPVQAVTGNVVEITNDRQQTGHGYFSATSPGSAPLATLEAEFERLASMLPGSDEHSVQPLLAQLDGRAAGLHPLRAALDCALHDLAARSSRRPLHDLFGGRRHDAFTNARVVALKSPQAMAAIAAGLAAEGYGFLKVKLSGDEALDVARVREVRAAAGTRVRLIADANETYQPQAAIRVIGRLVDFGVELIEQPTPGADLAGLAQVTRAVPITVEADESAPDLTAIQRIAAARAADSVSLRIANLGGLTNTVRAVALCEAEGLEYRFGAMFGASVLHAHTLHLASTLKLPTVPHEFSEFNLFQGDPFAGLRVEHGMVRVPGGPGTGLTFTAPRP